MIDGWPVILADTAGLRDGDNAIEQEGIRRARHVMQKADIILSLLSADVPEQWELADSVDHRIIRVSTKHDVPPFEQHTGCLTVSAVTGHGIAELREALSKRLRQDLAGEPALVARERQRAALVEVNACLSRALAGQFEELIAEELRQACNSIARLVGQNDIESVLDRLFAGFCIGK